MLNPFKHVSDSTPLGKTLLYLAALFAAGLANPLPAFSSPEVAACSVDATSVPGGVGRLQGDMSVALSGILVDGLLVAAIKQQEQMKSCDEKCQKLLAANRAQLKTVKAGLKQGIESLQREFDHYSWATFLALNAKSIRGPVANSQPTDAPLWSAWSSTADFIDGGSAAFGVRIYPAACKKAFPKDYQRYRVIDQVGKVDDSVEEAGFSAVGHNDPLVHTKSVGLSKSAVIAANGTFVRYEILINEPLHAYLRTRKLWNQAGLDRVKRSKDCYLPLPISPACGLDFPKASDAPTGGDPGSAAAGSIALKLAWMDLKGMKHKAREKYHRETLLVYNAPSVLSKSGPDGACSLVEMGLIGMHIARKTETQTTWIWSTFEHADNAPDCTDLPPESPELGAGLKPSTACPERYKKSYNLNPGPKCADGRCQACNVPPEQNCPHGSVSGWCIDQAPGKAKGYSQLCRQVPTSTYGSDKVNSPCRRALAKSVWGNYELISTQWVLGLQQLPVIPKLAKKPFAPASSYFGSGRPFLANTAMESYERSNCLKCHAAAWLNRDKDQPYTDYMYFVTLEVPDGPNSGR